jgi:hypothetical protein
MKQASKRIPDSAEKTVPRYPQSHTPVLMRVTRRSSTRKLGARLSPRRRALVDRFAKSRDGGFDHSVLSWGAP